MHAPTVSIVVKSNGLAWVAAVAMFLIAALHPSMATADAETAKPADSFVDSIGVNTHTFYTDTIYYERFDTVKERLDDLGVRHVREELMPDRPDQYERLRELADTGIESTLILGDPDWEEDELDELISILRSELRGDVAAVEGANEFDARGGSNWAGELREHQDSLYSAIKGDSVLSSLPVVGPSIVHHSKKRELGDISGDLDYGNIHSYPDGYFPESNLSTHLDAAADNSGSEPVMATESGYHTALDWHGEHKPITEDAMATYVPRMFLEYFRRGIARTFSYELLDQWPEPDERESNFGLLRHDLSPKPAFAALRNLIDILEDRGGGFSPAALDFTLSGDRDDLEHLLLQKSDGSFYLALWRTDSVWDPVARTALPAGSRAVTVNFARYVSGAEVFEPNVSSASVSLPSTAGGAISLDVGSRVVLLKVMPGGQKPERVKLWVSRRSVPAGGRVAVRGHLPSYARGRSVRVAVQHWRGRRRGGWRTVGWGRTSRLGAFRRAIRLSPARFGRVPRLRVVARIAKPSRVVRVRIRRQGRRGKRVGVSRAYALSAAPRPAAAR